MHSECFKKNHFKDIMMILSLKKQQIDKTCWCLTFDTPPTSKPLQVLENIVTSGVLKVSPQYKGTASLDCKSKHLYNDIFLFFLKKTQEFLLENIQFGGKNEDSADCSLWYNTKFCEWKREVIPSMPHIYNTPQLSSSHLLSPPVQDRTHSRSSLQLDAHQQTSFLSKYR